MIVFATEERIEAPVVEVWRHMVDPTLMQRWMKSIDRLSVAGGGAIGPEARLVFSARGAERSSEVVGFAEEQELSLRSTQGPITATYRYSLEADGPVATRARLQAECSATGWGKLIAPLIRVMVRRVDGAQMRDLKRAVEAGWGRS